MSVENGYKFDQEPVFRSSEGKDVIPFSKKGSIEKEAPEDETVSPNSGNLREVYKAVDAIDNKENSEKEEQLDLVLAKLQVCSTEQEAKALVNEYNQKYSKPFDGSKHTLFTNLGELKIANKKYIIQKTDLGNDSLGLLPIESEPSERDYAQAWDQIKDDKQLKGILAYLVRDDFDARQSLTQNDLKEFYKLYPTEDLYMQNDKIGNLLEEIKQLNTKEKYNEYQNKSMKFADILKKLWKPE